MSDQERLQILLSQTVMLLCKNGLRFEKELRIQGLLGITIDHGNVFIVHFNESLAHTAADNAVAVFSAQGSGNTVEIVTSNVPFAEASVGKASSTDEAAKPHSPNTINHSQELAVDKNRPSLRDDVAQVKVEQSSEMEADPVVLIESDTDEEATEATHLIATGHETSSQVWTQNVRKKCHPTKQSCSKRRPSAVISSTPTNDNSNSVTLKLEPSSLPCTGSDDQNFELGDSLSEQKWDTSESLSSRTDQTISIEFPSWQPRETRSSGSNLHANAVNHESVSKTFDKF